MKNIKLLLATTAILSMGTISAMAGTDTIQTSLQASIGIFNAFNINSSGGSIKFPHITTVNPSGSGKIKVKVTPDGAIDENGSNAQIARYNSGTTPIIISGSTISSPGNAFAYNYQNNLEAAIAAKGGEELTAAELIAVAEQGLGETYSVYGGTYNIELGEETIEMKDGNTPCGEVKNLTPKWRYNPENAGSLELRFGGTFEMVSDFSTDTENHCSGSTTVTFIMHP